MSTFFDPSINTTSDAKNIPPLESKHASFSEKKHQTLSADVIQIKLYTGGDQSYPEAAERLGLKTILVASHKENDQLNRLPKNKQQFLATVYLDPEDFSNAERLESALRKEGVEASSDTVFVSHAEDHLVPLAYQLSQRFTGSQPAANGHGFVPPDKLREREAYERAGIGNIKAREIFIASKDSRDDISREMEFPIIYKPTEGQGSEGLKELKSPEELESFALIADAGKKALVETYLPHDQYTEYSIQAVKRYGKKARVDTISEKIMGKHTDDTPREVIHIAHEPSRLSFTDRAFVNTARQSLTAVEVLQRGSFAGAYTLDVMLKKPEAIGRFSLKRMSGLVRSLKKYNKPSSGMRGDVEIIETNYRPGAPSELTEIVSGKNQFLENIAAKLTRTSPKPHHNREQMAAYMTLMPGEPDRLNEVASKFDTLTITERPYPAKKFDERSSTRIIITGSKNPEDYRAFALALTKGAKADITEKTSTEFSTS